MVKRERANSVNRHQLRQYHCSICGDEFFSDRPETEALAEAQEHFSCGLADLVPVCDHCWWQEIKSIYSGG